MLSKRQRSESQTDSSHMKDFQTSSCKLKPKEPFECTDYIEYNIGNLIPKGETVKKFTHLFYDPNTFYMKFLGFNNKRGIKINETQSIEGILRIVDIHYDGVVCRGRAMNVVAVGKSH